MDTSDFRDDYFKKIIYHLWYQLSRWLGFVNGDDRHNAKKLGKLLSRLSKLGWGIEEVIEIGANEGNWHIKLQKQYPFRFSAVVEPSSAYLSLLEKRFFKANSGRVLALNKAISNFNGEAFLSQPANTRLSALTNRGAGRPVSTITLASLVETYLEWRKLGLEQLTGKVLLKIDVEGHEESVLSSLEPSIVAIFPVIQFEVGSELDLDAKGRLFDQFASLGYSTHILRGSGKASKALERNDLEWTLPLTRDLIALRDPNDNGNRNSDRSS